MTWDGGFRVCTRIEPDVVATAVPVELASMHPEMSFQHAALHEP